MKNLSSGQQKILLILLKDNQSPSSFIHEKLLEAKESHSLLTTKRQLSLLLKEGCISSIGKGRAVKYELSVLGNLFLDINATEYCSIEPDKRYGRSRFNFDLLESFPERIFNDKEIKDLEKASLFFRKRSKDLPASILKREIERFVVEFSWKSSKIEGNTYSLLDTEKLLLENKVAKGKSFEETQMIINHKNVFDYVVNNLADFKKITKKNLTEVHAILVEKLNIDKKFREKPVGVMGSIYRPLDNKDQIQKAIDDFIKVLNYLKSPYDKALFILVFISYIQAFDDGNKRTARVLAIATLLANNLAPLSYRSVDEEDYKNAVLSFYELNSIIPLKTIFIDQYIFASENYLFNN